MLERKRLHVKVGVLAEDYEQAMRDSRVETQHERTAPGLWLGT